MGIIDKIGDATQKIVNHGEETDPDALLAEAGKDDRSEQERILEDGVEVPGPPLDMTQDASGTA